MLFILCKYRGIIERVLESETDYIDFPRPYDTAVSGLGKQTMNITFHILMSSLNRCTLYLILYSFEVDHRQHTEINRDYYFRLSFLQYISLHFCYYYRTSTKLREGNVFTGVCHSVGVGRYITCIMDIPPRTYQPPLNLPTPCGHTHPPPM